MLTIKFIEVGASKLSWSTQVKELSHETLLAAVKGKGALMSSDIDFSYDEQSGSGQVIVGMFRTVGRFEVAEGQA
jgi:hypothetical protein